MQVTLYITSDDRRVVSKTLTTIAANISIVPKEQLDILTPRIRIAWNSAYLSANYMYISELNRYYYISDMILNTGHNIDIIGNIDVLKTYGTQIRALTATVIRSESVGAPTPIPDSKLPIDPNREELLSIKITNTRDGSAVFTANPSDWCYILTVVGGLEDASQ